MRLRYIIHSQNEWVIMFCPFIILFKNINFCEEKMLPIVRFRQEFYVLLRPFYKIQGKVAFNNFEETPRIRPIGDVDFLKALYRREHFLILHLFADQPHVVSIFSIFQNKPRKHLRISPFMLKMTPFKCK